MEAKVYDFFKFLEAKKNETLPLIAKFIFESENVTKYQFQSVLFWSNVAQYEEGRKVIEKLFDKFGYNFKLPEDQIINFLGFIINYCDKDFKSITKRFIQDNNVRISDVINKMMSTKQHLPDAKENVLDVLFEIGVSSTDKERLLFFALLESNLRVTDTKTVLQYLIEENKLTEIEIDFLLEQCIEFAFKTKFDFLVKACNLHPTSEQRATLEANFKKKRR